MATKNIVPNADGEGQLGTSSKSWAQGHIDSITGTIATASQGSITSLGTLTALTLSGDVKIGTSTTVTPAAQADDIVIDKGASESGITIVSTTEATLRFADAGSSSVGFVAYNHGNNFLNFGTNGGTKLQIAATGELIYNSGGFIDFDGQSLQLNTQRNPNSGVFNDTSKSNASIGLNGASGGSSIIFKTAAANNTTATTRLTISSGGNVGIGTTPTTQFDIKGDNQHNYIRTYFSGNHISGFQFSDFNGGIWYDAAIDDLFVYAGHANSEISFTAGAAERLRISSEGRIKIPRAFNDTSNQPIIYVDSTIDSGVSTYQGSLLLQAGGAGSASYGAGLRLYGHAHASSPGSVEIGLSAASGATFTVDSFGAGGGDDILKVERDNYNTTIAGNLVIGTAGKGIDFSATSDGGASTPSELLDDYEEGTWTPSYVTNGVASTVAYNIRNGFYTKVGNQVTCWGNIQTNATTWNGDYVQLDGQPFAAANTTMPIGFIPYSFGFAGDHPGGIYYATSTRNYLTYRDAADGQTNELLASDMSPNNGVNTIIFSFTFQTTS